MQPSEAVILITEQKQDKYNVDQMCLILTMAKKISQTAAGLLCGWFTQLTNTTTVLIYF